MTPYLSLTEAADRVNVSTEWFLANVEIELPRPIWLNGEISWLAAAVDDWKTRLDAARDEALDELAALDQGAALRQFMLRIGS
jgi:predicted DNA-binding transcriptional regulator AlpA